MIFSNAARSAIPLRDRARGQWPLILRSIGIDDSHLKKGAPCPMCGGTDRFVFFDTNGDGTWYCRGCGKGSGCDLVMRFRGLEFRDAAKLIEEQIGGKPIEQQATKPDPDPRVKLRKMWAESQPTVPGDVVDIYLRSRGVGLDSYPSCIRTASSLRYWDNDATSAFPAMLAMVHDVAGKAVTIHRTYLAHDGGDKAPVEKPRKIVSKHGRGPQVRLAPVEPVMGIAEGIETALAAAKLFSVPVWSVLSTYGIETFEPPTRIEKLIVFADNDSGGAGQRAAHTLAARFSGQFAIEIRIPDQSGDWNDIIRARS
jgi:putative DNA primase/helicase